MFIISLSYRKPLSEVQRFIEEHRAYLDRHYASGHFLVSGRKEPRTGGVILATAASRSEVERLVQDDPFHRERIADYDIVEFLPSKAVSGLAHLVEI